MYGSPVMTGPEMDGGNSPELYNYPCLREREKNREREREREKERQKERKTVTKSEREGARAR